MGPRAHAGQEGGAPLERRVALTLFGVGALVCGAGAATKPDLTDAARAVQLATGAGFGVCGLALWLLPARRWLLEAGALSSVVLLGLLMGSSNAVGATPFFFLWPLVYLAYFSTRGRVLAGMAVMTLTVGVATALNPSLADRLDTFIGTVASVGLMTGLVNLMTRRERDLQAALAAAADRDALTGLLNRRGFAPELERLVAAAAADGRGLAVVMVDIDHFKRFNDRHGHLVGDEALCRTAGALTAAAGADDRVARIGGEEFTVALPGADAHAARGYADAVMRWLRDEPVADELRLTVSVGIATHGPDAATVHLLMRGADDALYRAKHAGRDQAVVAEARPLRDAA